MDKISSILHNGKNYGTNYFPRLYFGGKFMDVAFTLACAQCLLRVLCSKVTPVGT